MEVVLTTVIPCLDVSLLLIFTGSSVFKAILLELWLILPGIHHSCKKEPSLVAYQTSLCLEDGPIGVQVLHSG